MFLNVHCPSWSNKLHWNVPVCTSLAWIKGQTGFINWWGPDIGLYLMHLHVLFATLLLRRHLIKYGTLSLSTSRRMTYGTGSQRSMYPMCIWSDNYEQIHWMCRTSRKGLGWQALGPSAAREWYHWWGGGGVHWFIHKVIRSRVVVQCWNKTVTRYLYLPQQWSL